MSLIFDRSDWTSALLYWLTYLWKPILQIRQSPVGTENEVISRLRIPGLVLCVRVTLSLCECFVFVYPFWTMKSEHCSQGQNPYTIHDRFFLRVSSDIIKQGSRRPITSPCYDLYNISTHRLRQTLSIGASKRSRRDMSFWATQQSRLMSLVCTANLFRNIKFVKLYSGNNRTSDSEGRGWWNDFITHK